MSNTTFMSGKYEAPARRLLIPLAYKLEAGGNSKPEDPPVMNVLLLF